MVVTRIFKGMDSFVFICVPLYILAGDLMNATGLTERLGQLGESGCRQTPGELAQAQLVTTAVFGGISGSALGDIAALGTIFIPNLEKEGYGKNFACALTAASAVVDPIIPPSIIIVIYAAVMNTSIGAMYAAAIIPGILAHCGRHGDRPLPGQETEVTPDGRSRFPCGNSPREPGMPPWP